MKYRPEIDSLRALSVIGVILYHLDSPYFKGGFLGVDLFFVISGFLITRSILAEIETKSFKLRDFYDRRVRRILPIYFLIVSMTTLTSYFLLNHKEMSRFSESALYSQFFLSNHWFSTQDFSYWYLFKPISPLLHTWSLSIEEQFYLFYPIVLIALSKFTKKYWLQLTTLTILSIVIAFMSKNISHFNKFYMIEFRLWELAIGGFFSSIPFKFSFFSKSKFAYLTFLYMFLALIVGYFSLFNFSMNHPSYTIAPLLLTTGFFLHIDPPKKLHFSLLNLLPLIGLGKISYGLYLWHYPPIAFLKFLKMDTMANQLVAVLVSIILAVISYLLIERPIRNLNKHSLKYVYCSFTLVFILLFSINVFFFRTDGYPQRFGFSEKLLKSFKRTNPEPFCGQHSTSIEGYQFCQIGDLKQPISFIVIGDSHAKSAFKTLNQLGLTNKSKGLFARVSGCPPLVHLYPLRVDLNESRECHRMNQAALGIAKKIPGLKVILISRWDYYLDSLNQGDIILTNDHLAPIDIESSRKLFFKKLEDSIALYNETSGSVTIVHQVPHQNRDPISIYTEALKNKKTLSHSIIEQSITITEHRKKHGLFLEMIKELKKSYQFMVINPSDILCKDSCLVGSPTESYYFDQDHLSDTGFQMLESLFHPTFLKEIDQQ